MDGATDAQPGWDHIPPALAAVARRAGITAAELDAFRDDPANQDDGPPELDEQDWDRILAPTPRADPSATWTGGNAPPRRFLPATEPVDEPDPDDRQRSTSRLDALRLRGAAPGATRATVPGSTADHRLTETPTGVGAPIVEFPGTAAPPDDAARTHDTAPTHDAAPAGDPDLWLGSSTHPRRRQRGAVRARQVLMAYLLADPGRDSRDAALREPGTGRSTTARFVGAGGADQPRHGLPTTRPRAPPDPRPVSPSVGSSSGRRPNPCARRREREPRRDAGRPPRRVTPPRARPTG